MADTALTFEDGLGCAAEQIRNLKADAERFRWYFGSGPKRHFDINEYIKGCGERWDLNQWRAAVDRWRAAEERNHVAS